MQIQYLYDIDGKPKFVVIPMDIWEKLKNNFDIDTLLTENQVNKTSNKNDVRQFYGILKNKNIDVEKEIQQMRQEWEDRLKAQGL